MNINQLEELAREASSPMLSHQQAVLSTAKMHDAAPPAVILGLIAENKSRKSMLDTVINSVCAALERAGVTEVDDPGEAIDVLVADKNAEIARLRQALETIAAYPYSRDQEMGAAAMRKLARDTLDASTISTGER